jgi:hypothetical protein
MSLRGSTGSDAGAWSRTGTAVELLWPGQSVQARVHGVVHWSGTVETVSVPLGVVWIREDGLGERKLLDLQEYQVHPQEPSDE